MPKFDVLVAQTTINVIRNVQASDERAARETALAIMEEHTLWRSTRWRPTPIYARGGRSLHQGVNGPRRPSPSAQREGRAGQWSRRVRPPHMALS